MTAVLSSRPNFPERRRGVGIVGAGAIARTAHLPAYRGWDVPVVAVTSRTVEDAKALAADFGIETVHESLDAMLADPRVEIVDLATGPAGRIELIAAAVAAGKHVLAQKPLVNDPSELPRLAAVLDEARARGVRVAVNQNARWAPAWRLATLLIREGRIGEVVGVTHLHDKPLPPLVGTPFDDVPHMLLSDYLVHWIDITRCWLEGGRVMAVTASDHRVPGQPDGARNPWGADLRIDTSTGASAAIRIVGDARARSMGCPFWIHGTEGTLRGSLLVGSDHLTLERDGDSVGFPLTGEWFTDGFAGAMGELQTAIDGQREPENSAAHVVATVRMTLAAVESAEQGGTPVHPIDLELTTAGEPTAPVRSGEA
ncbi:MULTISPECIES: Gfo/Idh/MocA family protein [unclassified Microbacterium]|uniref:Gfo/Idh/MocA family protein n=1 Tax=unclassified Microbacterium TaxID=2609290 RepID=UPI000EA9BED9|nr:MULTISPECIES: Gfo/Idh/MocA family oxidoreductase [unclassified Microbacterium]MBT2483987.1 Gfo/Idh/MocA family oxidoreductase [Microbacterium sp. ISL-108]RKN66950.1 gfo/Idh/MocA family oxidoreductase [Microbacterium sp. CGR2]